MGRSEEQERRADGGRIGATTMRAAVAAVAVLIGAVGVPSASPAGAITDPTVIPAAPLPENAGLYAPQKVNDRADVLLSELLPPTNVAVSGDHGMVDLESLIGPGALGMLAPADLNSSGMVVGGDQGLAPGEVLPFWADLAAAQGGHLDVPPGTYAEAVFVGDDGAVVGIWWSGGPHLVAWAGRGGAMRLLERPGTVSSEPIDLDDHGHVVSAEHDGTTLRLVLWDLAGDTPQVIPSNRTAAHARDAFLSDDLRLLIPATSSSQTDDVVDLVAGTTTSYPFGDRCTAISPAGAVVCGTSALSVRDTRTGVVSTVGRPPGTVAIGADRGINRRGQIVLNASAPDGTVSSWLWDPIQGFHELLPPSPGTHAAAISDEGRVVGSSPGFRTGWITPPLTPIAPATATADASESAGVRVGWAPGGAHPGVELVGYRVWRDDVAIGDAPAGTLELVDAAASPGPHRYTVRSLTAAAGSAPVTASVQVAARAPTTTPPGPSPAARPAAPVTAVPALTG